MSQVYMPEGRLFSTSDNKRRISSISALQSAYLSGAVLEARATMFDIDKNLIVSLGGIRGIIPFSESAAGAGKGDVKEISILSKVGKPVCFTITDFCVSADSKPVAMLSRRLVQEQCLADCVSRLSRGDIIDGRITHMEQFGCFVDVGCGISALLPIDGISVSRISHPSNRFRVGQDIRCVVKAFDECGRIVLSHKELLGSWEENASEFRPGETVTGIVRSIESYGVFVELKPNLAGLSEPCRGVSEGMRASVYVKSIIPERMKIKLVIIDAFDNDLPPEDPEYYICADHIDHFRYSPDCCSRVVETFFK